MHTSERLEGWRNTTLPYIRQKLQANPSNKFVNSAHAMDAALSTFEDTVVAAHNYLRKHAGEDPQVLHGGIAHLFEEVGVPLDQAMVMVTELFAEESAP